MLKYYNSEKIEVGIDEAGRGCLAGPVFTGAVILPKDFEEEDEDLISQIKDSKKLSRKKRAILKKFIQDIAIDYNVSYKDNNYIDKHNILKSTHDCMHQSIRDLNIVPELILVDGNSFKPYYNDEELIENICIIGGDNKYLPIACASILAKEYHDEYIEYLLENDSNLEVYGWDSNMCYGTEKHIEGIKTNGLSQYHRKSFGICKDYL
jgi:ribonuclease HII